MFSSKQNYCCGGGDGDVEDDRVDDKFPMVELEEQEDEGNLPMVEHCLEPRKEQAEQLFLI